jgi:hypothetical protein
MTLTPDISDHAIDSDVDSQLICRAGTGSPESPDSQDLFFPEAVLFTRYPQLFQHDPNDSPYMDYFRCEVKVVLPYFEIFPSMVTEILNRATTDRGLLHTVLSVSHLIADSRLHRSLVPAFQHQTEALSLLQQQISATDITEALAISVAMLAWLNISRCNRPTLNQHLHGLYLIFQEIQTQGQLQSPLLKQIWRFSIRLDLLATTLFFPRTPLFPTVPVNQDHMHREWVRLSTNTDLHTEWTLASFALDNLMHRAAHISMKAYELRKRQPEQSSIQISKWIQTLLLEHSQWCTRPIVLQAQSYEENVNEPLPTSEQVKGTFLDYPPLQIYGTFYSNLLNTWRAIYIFIDLIATPEIGPSANPKRLSFAVDICRTYASLGGDDMFPIGKTIAVFLSGVAFGGKRVSPREVGWLYDSMVAKLQEYFPLNRTAVVTSHCCILVDCRLRIRIYGRWRVIIGMLWRN